MSELAVGEGRVSRRLSLYALPRMLLGKRRVLPGLVPTLGFTWFYLSVLVLIPIGALVLKAASLSWTQVFAIITSPRTSAALMLSFGASAAAAVVNTLVGTLVAWVLARYRFPGHSLLDAIVDLPFALPTSVAGIALTYVYSEHGWIGGLFAKLGLPIAFTRLGIVVALTFVGMPFVVRTVQPVVQEIDAQLEEAAASLGATKLQTFFRVLLPMLGPAIGAGFALSFARAVGEYGSVLFIAGNMPMKTEIASLLIITKLTQYDYAGAAAIAFVLLLLSFSLLLVLNALQGWSTKRLGY
jgi:sulfate transport system permease protein